MRRIINGPLWYRTILLGGPAVTSCEAQAATNSDVETPAVYTASTFAASPSSSFHNRKLTTVSFPQIDATKDDHEGGSTTSTSNVQKQKSQKRNNHQQSIKETKRNFQPRIPTRKLYAGEILQPDTANSNTSDQLMGANNQMLPFPQEVCGACTCHGLEPTDYLHFKTDPQTSDKDGVDKITGLSLVMKKINQDRGGVFFPYGGHKKTALFCVYDGHGDGGEEVAAHTMGQVEMRLQRHPQYESDIAKAFKETFLSIDSTLKDALSIDSRFCGCTACLVLIRDNTLYMSNIGDSRAVMSRRTPLKNFRLHPKNAPKKKIFRREAIPLTQDQNPDLPSERERIEKSGGYVSASPEPGVSSRVWVDESNTYLGLAMSRSVGDTFLKKSGVIAEPVVTSRELLVEEDEFIVLASDGVWEYIDSDEVVKIVGEALDEGKSAKEACKRLIITAAMRWKHYDYYYRDDITAIVVRISNGLFEDGNKNGIKESDSTSK